MSGDTRNAAFEVSILVYTEDDSCVALALEMDLRGFGATGEAALADLDEMILAQVSFALQKRHPESVWKPAEQKYWDMFEDARREQFIAQIKGTRLSKKGPKATMHRLPTASTPPLKWAMAGA